MDKHDDIITINGRHYHAGTGRPLDGQAPAPATHADKPGTRQLKHIAPHKPEHAKTLMRQAVQKPQASLKRRIKVQGSLGGAPKKESGAILTRPSTRRPNTERMQHPATKRPKGRLISHFSPDLFAVESHRPAITYGSAAVKRAAGHEAARPTMPAPAHKPRTTAELLDYAIQAANGPADPLSIKRHRKLFKRHVAV